MLHLEALESRCLLSNNSGLFVLAELVGAEAAAPLTNHLSITDSLDVEDDSSMDFGTHSVGYATGYESISFENITNDNLVVTVLFKDMENFNFAADNIFITGNTDSDIIDLNKFTASDLEDGEVDIHLEPGATGIIDLSFNPVSGPSDIHEVIKFKAGVDSDANQVIDETEKANNVIQTVDLYGTSTLLSGQQLHLNTAEISNTIIVNGSDNQFVYGNDPVEINLSLVNTSGNVVEDALLDLSFYLSSDSELNYSQDTLLSTQYIDLVSQGTSTATYSVNLPASTQGAYTIFAVLDLDHDVISEANFNARQIWSSGEFYAVTESVFVNDTEGSVDDQDINYGEVPVGSNSTIHYVNIVNTSSTDVSVDTNLVVNGAGFYIGYDRPEAIPAGYSSVSSKEVRPFDNLYAVDGEYYNWLTFDTLEMKTVTFGVDSYVTGANVYNSYGDLIAQASVSELYDAYDIGYYGDYSQDEIDELQMEPFTFEALGAGTYYIELLGAEGSFEVYIDSVDVYVPDADVITSDSVSTFNHTEETNIYSVVIDQPTELKGVIDLSISSDYYYPGIETYIALYNDPNQDSRYLPDSVNTTLEVYSEDGLLIYSYEYDFEQMYEDFISYYSYELANDLNISDDPFASDFFKQEIDIDLLVAGTYTFVYTQSTVDTFPGNGNGNGNNNDDTSVTEVLFSYTSSDSVFDLSKGDSLTIPVMFSPDASGEFNGSLEFNLVDSTDTVSVALHGNGGAGDLEITENAIEATYPENIQSDAIVTIASTIYNDGPGLTVGNSVLKFYLSNDDILGNDDDIALQLQDGSYEMALDDFVVYEEIEFLSHVYIPSVDAGDYYLFTELQQTDIASDPDTDVTSTMVWIDPYDTVVELSEINIDLNTSLVKSVEYSTDTDGIGNILEFGYSGIDSIIPEYLNFFNRSGEDVTITNVELASGLHYYTSLSANGGAAIPDEGVIITPGQYQRIYVYFDPQFFDTENVILNDVITVTTTETQYKVALNGEVLGADLVVLENTGAEANDDIIVMPATRPGKTSEMVSITLANMGNEALTVNEFDFLNPQTPFSVVDPIDGTVISAGITIQPGESAVVGLLFEPTTVGTSSGVLTIRSTDPANDFEYNIDISGEGVNPVVRVYEDSATPNDNSIAYGSYGTVKSSDPVEQIILHNIGSDTLYISDISFANDNPNDFAILEDLFGENSVIEVAPGEQLVFNVEFIADIEGSYSDTLNITSLDDVEVIHFGGSIEETEVYVSKQGSTDPVDEVDLGSIAVNSLVTESEVEKIQIFNFNVSGHSSVFVSTIEITNSGFSLLDSEGNSTHSISVNRELDPGEKISLYVQFDAYYDGEFLADGEHTGTVTINGSAQTQYDVSCTVVTPEIELDSSSLTFEETLIGQKSSQFITVANTGTSDLTITGYNSTDDQFTIFNSNVVIPAGESAQLEFVYEPDSIDSSSAVITLLTGDMDESEIDINVAGVSAGNILAPSKVSGDNYTYVFNNADDQRVKLIVKYVTEDAKSDAVPYVYLDSSDDSGNISKIVMPGSAIGSSISISGEVEIYSIEAGSLKAIKASNADLDGDIYLTGSIGQIQLDQIAADSSITVLDDEKDVSVKADTVAENTVFDIHADVKTFQASTFDSGSLIANDIQSINVKNDLGADLISYNEIKSVNVKGDIDGDIRALKSIGSVKAGGDISDNFIIAGDDSIDDQARAYYNGSIKSVQAGGDISANIMAADDIDKIMAAKGNMSGYVRADNIKSVKVANLDNAVISAADSLGSVSVKSDISDSFLMGGYDIGVATSLNELASFQDDSFGAGSIGKVSFGGQFSDSYVTAGAMPSFALDSLYGFSLSGGENQSEGSSNIGSIKGKYVDTSSDSGTIFGFYASGAINSNLSGNDDFQIVESF